MTEALQEQVEHWFAVYKDRLHLGGWDVDLRCNDDPGWGRFGQCSRDINREQARVTISVTMPPNQARKAVIHELLHLSVEPIETVVDQWKDMLDETHQPLFLKQCEFALETVIYRLERCLADWEVE
jgi:hypothetical protein